MQSNPRPFIAVSHEYADGTPIPHTEPRRICLRGTAAQLEKAKTLVLEALNSSPIRDICSGNVRPGAVDVAETRAKKAAAEERSAGMEYAMMLTPASHASLQWDRWVPMLQRQCPPGVILR